MLGAPWLATVDLTTTGHARARILGFTSPATLPLPGGQVQLLSGARLFQLPFRSGPIASWTPTLPSDCALAGLTAHTQAVHLFGAPSFALSNALDLRLGF